MGANREKLPAIKLNRRGSGGEDLWTLEGGQNRRSSPSLVGEIPGSGQNRLYEQCGDDQRKE